MNDIILALEAIMARATDEDLEALYTALRSHRTRTRALASRAGTADELWSAVADEYGYRTAPRDDGPQSAPQGPVQRCGVDLGPHRCIKGAGHAGPHEYRPATGPWFPEEES